MTTRTILLLSAESWRDEDNHHSGITFDEFCCDVYLASDFYRGEVLEDPSRDSLGEDYTSRAKVSIRTDLLETYLTSIDPKIEVNIDEEVPA